MNSYWVALCVCVWSQYAKRTFPIQFQTNKDLFPRAHAAAERPSETQQQICFPVSVNLIIGLLQENHAVLQQ